MKAIPKNIYEGLTGPDNTGGIWNPDSGELEASSFSDRPSATRQSSSLHYRPRDSRLCVPASRQVCHFVLQSRWKIKTV